MPYLSFKKSNPLVARSLGFKIKSLRLKLIFTNLCQKRLASLTILDTQMKKRTESVFRLNLQILHLVAFNRPLTLVTQSRYRLLKTFGIGQNNPPSVDPWNSQSGGLEKKVLLNRLWNETKRSGSGALVLPKNAQGFSEFQFLQGSQLCLIQNQILDSGSLCKTPFVFDRLLEPHSFYKAANKPSVE